MEKAKRLLMHIVVAAFPLISSSSCSLMRPHQPKSMAYSSKELSVKPDQIGLRIRSLVEPFTEIEHSADAIVAGTSDISVKRAATCLRMENELNQIVTNFTVARNVTKVRVYAKKWAMDHPINYAIRNRKNLSRATE